MVASAIMAMFAIIFTASSGYPPAAVSPDSIVASVPSLIALATSVTSARVGRGLRIMESSICVAVMTGLYALLHFWMISFWMVGQTSGATSTPRSPRATMMPSASFRMSSKW